MDKYTKDSKMEALKMLKLALDEVVLEGGNFKYALAEGIVSLEKQIPEKVLETKDRHDFNGKVIYQDGYCPICKNELSSSYVYCNSCGQLLDWD